ncbi:hypothetical protein [Paenibacillus senegalensis]|uniref:hypothetical protein n=1 Tax=Paenibacillus senegalensis TaxID=1465766 RepID=UPI00031BF08F|nr:hypothetical protein [Paenibacillus senegalensis]
MGDEKKRVDSRVVLDIVQVMQLLNVNPEKFELAPTRFKHAKPDQYAMSTKEQRD